MGVQRQELLPASDLQHLASVLTGRSWDQLSGGDGEHLTATIVAAGRAGDMGRNAAAALSTFSKLPGMPTIGGFAGAEAHFRYFTFRYSHNYLSWLSFN